MLQRFATHQPGFDVTDGPAGLLRGLGGDPEDPQPALERIRAIEPALLTVIEPMLGVTMTPTMAHASDKMNVIPSRAYLKVDCRVPPGHGEDTARRRIEEVLGDHLDHLELEFTETVVGNSSPLETELMAAIDRWIEANDPDADTVPVILPGFSDSRWFREAFPDCVAYGFFPQRYMPLLEAAQLVHSADERIDVRDLRLRCGLLRRSSPASSSAEPNSPSSRVSRGHRPASSSTKPITLPDPEDRPRAERGRQRSGQQEAERQQRERAHPVPRADARQRVRRDVLRERRLPPDHQQREPEPGREGTDDDQRQRSAEREHAVLHRPREHEQQPGEQRTRRTPADPEQRPEHGADAGRRLSSTPNTPAPP